MNKKSPDEINIIAEEVRKLIDAIQKDENIPAKKQKEIAGLIGIKESELSSVLGSNKTLRAAQRVQDKLIELKEKGVVSEKLPQTKITENDIFIGTYQVKWKKKHRNNYLIEDKLTILSDSEATYSEAISFTGTVKFKQGKLYLIFEDEHEMFYFIIVAGNRLVDDRIKYMSGIVLCVESRSQSIYSYRCLFIKDSKQPIDQQRIDDFFAYVDNTPHQWIDYNIPSILAGKKDFDIDINSSITNSDKFKEVDKFIGEYEIHWKEKHRNNKLELDRILIQKDGKASYLEEAVTYEGNAIFKEAKLYLTFEDDRELVYAIFAVGSILIESKMQYLAGIILCRDSKTHDIYSYRCLLIKKRNLLTNEVLEIDAERVENYFNYIESTQYEHLGNDIRILLDTYLPLTNPAVKSVFQPSQFVGNWDEVSLAPTFGGILIRKLQFLANGKLLVKGINASVDYKGHYEEKGNNLYLYLSNSKKNATVTICTSQIDAEHIKVMVGSYIAPAPHDNGNVLATLVFIKETSPLYQNTKSGIYEPHTEVYKYYEKHGIINELRIETIKTYSMDIFKPLP